MTKAILAATLIAVSRAFAFDSYKQSEIDVANYTESQVLWEMAATALMSLEAVEHKDYQKMQFCHGRLIALNNRWQVFRAQRGEKHIYYALPPGWSWEQESPIRRAIPVK
jgi:hypothetical protein